MRYCTFLFVLLCTTNTYSQITVKNQTEYTYWKEFDRNILENWSDISYQKDFVQLGSDAKP